MIKFLSLLLITFQSYQLIAQHETLELVDADDPTIAYMGRMDNSNPKAVKFAYPGVSVYFSFTGRYCNIRMKDQCTGKDDYGNPFHNYYDVSIDGKDPFVLVGDPAKEIYIIDSLNHSFHTIKIFKRTEGMVGVTIFKGFEIEKGGKEKKLFLDKKKLKMEFIGNSQTCGYGVEGESKDCKFSAATENNHLAFGCIAANTMGAEYVAVAYSGKGIVRNYDLTQTELMVDIYPRTLPDDKNSKWDFKKWHPDYVTILVGDNDFANSIPDSASFVDKYVEFVKFVHSNYPHAHIICAVSPSNEPNSLKQIVKVNYFTSIVKQLKHHGVHKSHLLKFNTTVLDFGCNHHYGIKTHEKLAEELVNFIRTEIIEKESKLMEE
jgi:hypothetical protein